MVSFIYVCTLIPSEPSYYKITWFYPIIILPFIILIINIKRDINNDIFINFKPLILFNMSTIIFTIILIVILLLTLLVIRSNTLQLKTPMRSFF